MRTPVLAALLLSPVLSAQSLTLEPCGGSLGNPISYKLTGGANKTAAFLTSLQRATIPLTWLDPNETRTLGVGLDIPGLILFLPLGASGSQSFNVTIPNTPVLAGLGVLHQAVSFPGANGAALDGISKVNVVTLAAASPSFTAQTNDMSVSRLSSTSIDLEDGRILVVGGAKGTLLWQNAHNTTEIYDVATRSFTAGPTMVAPRASHTQTRLKDGRYLFVGGVNDKNVPQKSCEIYDPKTGKFTAAASLARQRTMHSASLLPNGNVIVMGGISDMSSGQTALTTQWRETEIYNPSNNTWSNGPRMSRARAAHAAVDIGNGRILVCGGLSYTSIIFFRTPNIQSSCEIYDAGSNRFTRISSMNTTRALMSAFRLSTGKVLVAGGMTGNVQNGGIATELCQIYDPSTGRWSSAASLPTKSAGSTGVHLRSGFAAVIGGGSNTIYWPRGLDTSNAYDHVNDKWIPLPKMAAGRLAPIARELQACGMVLIGGGTTNSASAVATHELWVK